MEIDRITGPARVQTAIRTGGPPSAAAAAARPPAVHLQGVAAAMASSAAVASSAPAAAAAAPAPSPGPRPGRAHAPTAGLALPWEEVERRLLADPNPSPTRPQVLPEVLSFPIFFMENAKVKRKPMANGDRWHHSGGKRGSTVWPAPGAGLGGPRIRRKYGKVWPQTAAARSRRL